MTLSLRSGIHSEVNWALDRLHRLCNNDKFLLKDIPFLIDALFDWPEWFVRTRPDAAGADAAALFSAPAEEDAKVRHAVLGMLVLRNAANNPPNAAAIAAHARTRPLVLAALARLRPEHDAEAEVLLYAADLFHALVLVVPSTALALPAAENPVPHLARAARSSNRSLALAALNALAAVLAHPANAHLLPAAAPALATAIQLLPVFAFGDNELAEAAVNFLYAHLSSPANAKAFLLHPDMPSTLRLLVDLLLFEQVEEKVNVDIPEPAPAPARDEPVRYRRLGKAELDALAALPEPTRHMDWCAPPVRLPARASRAPAG
jgi:chromatin structure-remodeling complex subunit RSC9